MDRKDGMNFAPKGKPCPVVTPGEFVFSAVALDHGHIYGMCGGLTEAGGTIKYVYDKDPEKVRRFIQAYPSALPAACEEEVLNCPETRLIASAAVPNERCALGIRVMRAGKDYFTDKTPLTTLEQLQSAKDAVADTGKKYMVYYSERLHSEGSVLAGQLVNEGAIGRVLQVMGMGPHRLNAPARPEWFFIKEQYGGILCDIGSHQIEQILYFTGARDARVVSAQIANHHHPAYPELEDFGDAVLVTDNGCSGYFRVDWFTPDGLRVWGDGRTFILGTEGYIEMRKYINITAQQDGGDHVFLVNGDGERHYRAAGSMGYPFFGDLILDCINRTENAMTQEHAFKAAELCVRAQMQANRIIRQD